MTRTAMIFRALRRLSCLKCTRRQADSRRKCWPSQQKKRSKEHCLELRRQRTSTTTGSQFAFICLRSICLRGLELCVPQLRPKCCSRDCVTRIMRLPVMKKKLDGLLEDLAKLSNAEKNDKILQVMSAMDLESCLLVRRKSKSHSCFFRLADGA